MAELFAASDYVISILPSTHNTRGLLNGDALQPCSAKVRFGRLKKKKSVPHSASAD